MRGKVSFEEAYEIPALADSSRDQAALYIAPNDLERYLSQIKHPTGERLELSNNTVSDTRFGRWLCPAVRELWTKPKHARDVNDWIANEIKDHRDRMGAFAALSMHDPAQAAQELERCVKEHGFHGALVNNWQLGCRWRDLSFLWSARIRRLLEEVCGARRSILSAPLQHQGAITSNSSTRKEGIW